MSVQKDAGNLLLFFYKELVQEGKTTVGTREVLDETGWKGHRINQAYNYLNDLGLIKSYGGMGNIQDAYVFGIMRLYPEGINIIENQESRFKKQFGFTVSLGLIKFNWGASEK